jgi:hypothetical protein
MPCHRRAGKKRYGCPKHHAIDEYATDTREKIIAPQAGKGRREKKDITGKIIMSTQLKKTLRR